MAMWQSRRAFLSTGTQGIVGAAASARGTALSTATLSAALARTAAALPAAHPAGSDEIRVALIGCGGRGGGAAANALGVPNAPLKLWSMADVIKERADIVKRSLGTKFQERLDVPEDRTFIGFEAYKQAIDALRPGDIAIFATPPAFRAVHFAYAIQKGVHTFMEKPVSVDGPSTKRIIELAAQADAKKLKVGVGLMCRHCARRRELFDRLQAGEAGDLIAFRAYREHNPVHNLDLAPGPPAGTSELLWQVKRFHNFLWASGGIYSDYYIHHVDEVCWMKNAWPVSAEATGGRHYRGKIDDQNFDSYAVEYTFHDGAKFFYSGRAMKDCRQQFGAFGQGTKGAFTISARGHAPSRATIYTGQTLEDDKIIWTAAQPEPNPYQEEWNHLVEAIVSDTPYNEAVRGAEASLATAMGRFAAHTGRLVTFDEMLNMPADMTAAVASLTDDSPAPLAADGEGRYPAPMPGRYKFEYHD
jgi:predicted dehydrogenase